MLLEESKGMGVVQTKTLRQTGKLGNGYFLKKCKTWITGILGTSLRNIAITESFHFRILNVNKIDPFKVNAAILPGVQTYWGERAANHKLLMADSCGRYLWREIITLSKILLRETILF